MNPQDQNRKLIIDWHDLDICCLDVSLNNRYQTGPYLSSMIEWINRRFKSCILSLGDTLHRHNLRYQYPDKALSHAIALKAGNQWLEENAKNLEHFQIPYTLFRSDDWLALSEFDPIHEDLWNFYNTDQNFSESVSRDIQSFVDRRPDLPSDFVRSSSLTYLLEETAADILLGQRNAVVHLYPGKWHECYFNLMERAESLPPRLRGLEKCVFKRISPGKIMGAVNINKQHIPAEEPHRKRV
jgi:tRNA-dependent cyclodipeptide synthase